jgi:hypothetical protein
VRLLNERKMEKVIEENYQLAVQGIKQEWFEVIDNQWFFYVQNLPEKLKITYLVVVLDWQVVNGGFHQYFSNGYGQFSLMTIDALSKIGALQKADILKEVYKVVNYNNYDEMVFSEKLRRFEIDLLFKTNQLDNILSEFNDLYDSSNDIIDEQLKIYLSTEI